MRSKHRLRRTLLLLIFDVLLLYVAYPYYAALDLRKALVEEHQRGFDRWVDGAALLASLHDAFPANSVTLAPACIRAIIADGVPCLTSETALAIGNVRRAYFSTPTTFTVKYDRQVLSFALNGLHWRLTGIKVGPPRERPAPPPPKRVLPPPLRIVQAVVTDATTITTLVITQYVALSLTGQLGSVAYTPPPPPPPPPPPKPIDPAVIARVQARLREIDKKIQGFARSYAAELRQIYPSLRERAENRRRLAEYEQSLRDDYWRSLAAEETLTERQVEEIWQALQTNAPATTRKRTD